MDKHFHKALVIGASGGIGAALVAALAQSGAQVTGLSRRDDGLDVTREASVIAALSALTGPFDLIVVATGALALDGHGPEKSLRALSFEALAAQFALNSIGPALVLKHAARLMPRDADCTFAALSARVGSIGDNRSGGWYGYRAAKAALNQIVHSAAIELARSHPQARVVALHPGTVNTPLTAAHRGSHPAMPPATAATHLLAVLAGLQPKDSGGFFDWQGQPVPW